MNYEIITLPKFRAVGLRWEGVYSDVVPHLKNIIQQMEDRSSELAFRMNPSVQLGLSYHVVDNGFAHYAVYEVSEEQEIPDGMIEIKVPEWSYVRTTHYKGNNVQKTYHDLHHWLEHNGFNGLREAGVQYYEPYTPIKHEYYPIDRDPKDPHFEIYIPIVKK